MTESHVTESSPEPTTGHADSDAGDGWGVEAVGETIGRQEAAGQVFVLEGLSASHLYRRAPQLRQTLADRGMPLFILDPTGTRGAGETFHEVLVEYVQLADQRGKLSDRARSLFEFVSSATGESHGSLFPTGDSLYQDTLGRLWTSVCRQLPAVLLVVHARHCSPSELHVLDHLASFFFSDPIEELTPELDAVEAGCGRLVYLDDGGDFPVDLDDASTTVVDLSAAAEASVRQFLADPDVIQRFVDSTGGDPQRLDELVHHLPGNLQNFWWYRYERLDGLQKRLIDVVAVAGNAVSVDALQTALSLTASSDYFARSLRQVTDAGFVERTISSGMVRVRLESFEFGDAVAESLDEDVRRELHQALADAELANHAEDPSAVVLARHYLAAGQIEAGFRYGLRAVETLVGRRAYDPAHELLEVLLEHADQPDDRRDIYSCLVQVDTELSNYRKALAHCNHLEELSDTPQSTARVQCQAGNLLIKVGEFQAAVELYQQAEALVAGGDSDDGDLVTALEAKLGQAEGLYSQGGHDAAEKRSQALVEHIQHQRSRQTGMGRAFDSCLCKARNLIAKVAILRGECARPRKLLAKNQSLAKEWGWDDEVARAELNLGLVALEEKNFEKAYQHHQRALELGPSPGSVRRAYTWINLGIIHQRQSHYGESLRYYLEGLRASRQCGNDVGYSSAAHNLVTLYQRMGAFERAFALVEHMRQRQSAGSGGRFVGEALAVVCSGLRLDQRRYGQALDVLARAAEVAADNQAQSLPLQEARLRSVEAHLALGQRSAAKRILDAFEMPEEAVHQPQLQALYRLGRARLALDEDDPEPALSMGRSIAEQSRSVGYVRDGLQASSLLARALQCADRPEEARVVVEEQLDIIRRQAAHVPQAHRREFFAVPIHQDLADQLDDLGGQAPDDFIIEPDDRNAPSQPTVEAELDDPAFQQWRSRYGNIVGEDPRLHQLFRMVDRVAESDSPVLLQGESGTGKELVAEAVHTQSDRQNQSFIKLNCAAFVDDLLLSELFGHVEGAFTGAVSDKVGRFELADQGTIFLDEIGDISPKTQVALLRVLQEGRFEPVGGTQTRQVDARVVCATNKDLEELVDGGDFRLDLYYRLKGVVMELPPLRERRQDIPRLVGYFAQQFSDGAGPKSFSTEVLEFLASYSWPGNVRELKNFVKSVLLFTEGDTIQMAQVREFSEFFAPGKVDLDVPEIDYSVEFTDYEAKGTYVDDAEDALVDRIIGDGLSLSKLKDRLELESIRRALIENDGNITHAAKMLKMKRPRLSQIVNSTDELLAVKNKLVG